MNAPTKSPGQQDDDSLGGWVLGKGKRKRIWADLARAWIYQSAAIGRWAQNGVTMQIHMKKEGKPRDLYPQTVTNDKLSNAVLPGAKVQPESL